MKRMVLIDWEHKDGTKGQTSKTYVANSDSTAIKKARVFFAKKYGSRGYVGKLFQVNHGNEITAVLPARFISLDLTPEEAQNLSTVLNTLVGHLQYKGLTCPNKDLKKISEAWRYWNGITKKLAEKMGMQWSISNEKTEALINS